jgi:hypothetical protein
MAIGDDFSVNASGDIRHVANTNHYTVLQLHRWLQDLADDAEASGNDIIDISRATPSERSTNQIIQLLGSYNIDDDAAEYLYGGSIKQGTGATEEIYYGLKVLGAVNDSNTQLMVIQANAYYQYTTTPASPFWGDQSGGGYNGNATENILMQVLIKGRTGGVSIDQGRIRVQSRQWGDTYDFFNVTLTEGENVAAIGTTPDPQNNTAIGTVQGWTGGDIPTNTEGYQQIDIQDGNGNQPYYSKWTYNTNSAGMKAVWEWIKEITGNDSPEAAEPYDMNGELFLGITHSFAFDAGSGAGTQNETVVWGTGVTYDNLSGGTFTEGYLVRFSGGAAGTVLYDNNTTYFIMATESVSDTIAEDETITEYDPSDGSASGVTAQVNTPVPTDQDKEGGQGCLLGTTGTTTGSHYIQLLTGKAPVDGLNLYGITSTNDWDVNGAVTARTVPKIFLGSYTGSLIGAYGVGIDPDDVTYPDTVEDLGGNTRYAPQNIIWYFYGLEVGDRILVGKKHSSNSDFDFSEMTLNTALTGAAETYVDVGTGNIPADAPSSGILRVTLDDGRIRYAAYDSHDGDDQFALNASYQDWTDPNDAAIGKGVMLAFLDKTATGDTEQFTIKYDAPRTLWARRRDGGGTPKKTYEAQSTLGATGGSATATIIEDD